MNKLIILKEDCQHNNLLLYIPFLTGPEGLRDVLNILSLASFEKTRGSGNSYEIRDVRAEIA